MHAMPGLGLPWLGFLYLHVGLRERVCVYVCMVIDSM